MNKSVLFACFCLLFLPSRLTAPAQKVISQRHVSDVLSLNHNQRVVAQRIENRLKQYRFSDGLVIGAIVNAYAESRLNPNVIGFGNSRGVFQMMSSGLGHDMSIDEMHNIEASSDRVAAAVKKNKRMMQAENSGADAEAFTSIFCLEIEKPKISCQER